MPTGFDFDQLMQSPLFQMGLATLAQPRSWENRGLTGIAQGAMQGMGNYQQAKQAALRQQLEGQQLKLGEQQLADLKAKQDAAARKMELLKEAAAAYMLKQPKPRAMAFTPQPGDEAVRDQYSNAQMISGMLAAGVDPTDIANFNKVLSPKPEKPDVHVVGGNLVTGKGEVLFSAPEKPETGPAANLSKVLDTRDKFPRGSATWKLYNSLADKMSNREPAVQVNMNPLSGFQTIIGPDGKPQVVGVQVGRSGEMQISPVGQAAPHGNGQQLPVSVSGKLFENRANLRRAELASDLLEGKTVGALKGDKNATGYKGLAPEMLLQRIDPEGVTTRAAIADIGSLVIHDRSGAAVTAKEFPRLRPFIPSATDDAATAKKKVSRFVQEYKAIVNDIESFYTDAGYTLPKINPPSAAPEAPAAGGLPAGWGVKVK